LEEEEREVEKTWVLTKKETERGKESRNEEIYIGG
jgi:hypothetical protein